MTAMGRLSILFSLAFLCACFSDNPVTENNSNGVSANQDTGSAASDGDHDAGFEVNDDSGTTGAQDVGDDDASDSQTGDEDIGVDDAAVNGVEDAAVYDVDDDPETTPLSWVTDNLVALYTFEEESGATVHDVSGVGPALDLMIEDTGAVLWSDAGLTLSTSTIARSPGAAEKVNSAMMATHELTIDAWVTPAFTNQDGPARIVTSSDSTSTRNFTLGQASSAVNGRLRTTTINDNGHPGIQSEPGFVNEAPVHLVYTRDTSGDAALYVDGTLVHSEAVTGDLSSWDPNYALALGRELTGERPWLGTYHRVGLYDRALTPEEVATHHDLGNEELTFEVPDDAFPTEPFGPSAGFGTEGEGGGFLWKPISESDGNLVILLPSQYTGVATGCHVANAAGDLIETGHYTGDGNGNRQHYRFGQPGSAYGTDLYVVAYTPTGNIHWQVANGSERTEY